MQPIDRLAASVLNFFKLNSPLELPPATYPAVLGASIFRPFVVVGEVSSARLAARSASELIIQDADIPTRTQPFRIVGHLAYTQYLLSR